MNIENTHVFCDVDGTLGVEDKGIPVRNREAIRRFTEMGGHFAVCTGRWVESVRRFCKGLPINSLCVIGNGAGIYDFQKDEVLYYQSLPEEAAEIYADIISESPHYGMLGVSLANGYHYLGDKKKNLRAFSRALQYPVRDELEEGTYVKFHIGLPGRERVGTVVERFNTRYAAYLDRVRFVQTDEQYIELLPVSANKGTGIRKIASLLDVEMADTVFIGNHYNDVEAFNVAGMSACVASTPKALRFLPTYQLGESMNGAVADMLNMLMRKARIEDMELEAVS